VTQGDDWVIRGADWYMTDEGKIIMNYGGYIEPKWGDWQSKFCWLPKQIVLRFHLDNDPDRSFMECHTWVWLKTVYVRERTITTMHGETKKITSRKEYEYTKDLFDLIKKESR
jgi:hypothetical protein